MAHMRTVLSPADLADDDLLQEAVRLVRAAHEATAALVRVLMEVDRRRLYLRAGCSSLFVWCVQVLHLDEGAAYNRIEVARAARRHPAVIDALDHGGVSLTAARLLAPHLTASNHIDVLARASGRTTRAIHLLVAELAPRPAVPSSVRRLPSASGPPAALEAATSSPRPWSDLPPLLDQASAVSGPPPERMLALPTPSPAEPGADAVESESTPDSGPGREREPESGSTPGAVSEAGAGAAGRALTTGPVASRTAAPATVVPLSPVHFRLQVTITSDTHATLRHAQNLLRHTMPGGDLAAIVARALTVLVRELERQRWARTRTPRPADRHTRRISDRPSAQSRHIPSFVRRAVWQRDEGRCAYVGPHGRCDERAWLEFHHVRPFAVGGPASVENIALRCRAHNAYEGAVFFGKDTPRRRRKVSGTTE